MTEYKHCPFCNGAIQIVNRPWLNGDAGWEIEHINLERAAEKKCPIVMGCYDTEQEAIEAWNTRYEPTCRMMYSGDPEDDRNELRRCTNCGAFNIHALHNDGDTHPAIAKFCPECGAKVIEE